jgi:dihydrofolate reductase
MSRLIVTEWMTLDGVVQAPIDVDEDTSGGFRHGGWHRPHAGDDTFRQWMVTNLSGAAAFLLGRRTWEQFAAYWPASPAEVQDLAQPLNGKPKHVVSSTLRAPLAWQNSTVLEGEVAPAVAALKARTDGDLLVMGSTQLVRTLLGHELVDELRLMIDPVIVGGGKRIFPDGGAMRQLRLADSRTTSTGAMIVTYQ